MPLYEVEHNGKLYEVEADSPEQAAEAFGPAPEQAAPAQPAASPQSLFAQAQQGVTDAVGATAANEALDVAATLGTGALSLVGSGLAGLAGTVVPGEAGQGARWQENVQALGTWSPKTQGGQQLLGGMGEVFSWIDENVTKPTMEQASRIPMGPVGMYKMYKGIIDGKLPEKSPFKAAVMEAVVGTFFPGKTAVAKGQGKTALNFAKDMNRQEHDDAAKRLGIDLENNTIKESIPEAVRLQAGGDAKPAPGDIPLSRATAGAEDISTGVKTAFEESRLAVNAGYTLARSKDAAIAYEPIAAMVAKTRDDFQARGVRVDEMGVLDKRLREVEKINEEIIGLTGDAAKRARPGSTQTILGPDAKPLPVGEAPTRIPLNELESVAQTLSGNIKDARAQGRLKEAEALIQLRRDLNGMLDQQFMKDMVFGDDTAKAAWNAANFANQRHKGRFSDDKVVASIIKNDYNSAQIVKLVLGASEAGHRLEAVNVVKNLKGILGKDAPEMQSIKTAVYLDMFDPIFKDNPGWSSTLERMRKIRKNEGALLNELGISSKDLDFFEKAIKVASKVKTRADFDTKGWFSQAWSKLLFGHDIARAGLFVKTANLIADRALGVGQKTHARLLAEFANDAGVTSQLSKSLTPAKIKEIGEKALIAEYLDREEEQSDR